MASPSPELPPKSRSGREALDVAQEAARVAGRIIQDRFQTSLQISYKGPADIVTDVDLAAEKAVLDLLREEYPEFGSLAEESQPVETGSPFTWVVDPLDGTRNFASGIPHFCTVVALAHQGEIVLGVTYDPMRDELFSAELGKGAFFNGAPMSVSDVDQINQAVLCFDLGYLDEKAGLALDLLRSLLPGIQGFRLMGSAGLGLAYAAAGRVDIYFHHSLSPWDMASGLLLAREAGGEVVDRQGQRAGLFTPSVIASNPALIQSFLQATEGHPWREG
ncbi:MAG: inositol monophosphatase [Chloroflexi bacterium]|nr:inositol monophosphatase [Chloroflexota bacterium]MCI0793229.1 inositol monophosphatase [Chloroflexota bacterium]MCI0857575.1 inositol monophosphatase [Chloroflexota bacterium]